MYTVAYTRDAAKTLRKLPRDVVRRITAKVAQYAADPASQANNVKKLTEHPGYRLRVGDWRAVFLVDDGEMVVTVVKVGARGGVYE
jgi:mRNA interferase RelE/StbE